MSSLFNRLIRIVSCTLVIASVLLCSVCLPAQALNNVLYAWDYLSDQYEENGYLNYSFRFQSIPTYYVLVESVGGTVQGVLPLEITSSPGTRWIQIHAWPFGVRNWANVACSGGVIAVSDFERFMDINLSCTATLFFEYYGTTAGSPYTFQIKSNWNMYYYDVDGNYIGSDSTDYDERSLTYTEPVKSISVQSMGIQMQLELPENAAYFCPMLKTQLNLPAQGSDFVYKVIPTFDGFSMGVRASSVMQNTETLMKIEEQLDNLNEKAETIISGSEDMQDQADFMLDQSQDLDDRLNAAISELEALEDLSDKALVDDYKDFSAVANDIMAWLATRSWNDFISLVQPIMEFPAMVTILTMLVSFINISVLFFGR